MKVNNRFQGKNSRFLSKGGKFKRRQWAKKTKSGQARFGYKIKKSDSNDEDEQNINHNLIVNHVQGLILSCYLKKKIEEQVVSLN